MFKLIIHISDLEKWSTAINNVQNTAKALTQSNTPFNIAIIANAGAVKGYLDPEIRHSINQINHTNIQFLACNNSLTGLNISLEMLNPTQDQFPIVVVPVAIISLVEYQKNGFAYIKP